MENKPFVISTSHGSFTVMARDAEHAVDIAGARIESDAAIKAVALVAGKALEEAYPWGYRSSDREP